MFFFLQLIESVYLQLNQKRDNCLNKRISPTVNYIIFPIYIIVVANKSIRAYEPSLETLTKIIVQLIPCYQDQNLLLLNPPEFCCFLTEHQPGSLRSNDDKMLQKPPVAKRF